MQFSPIRPNTAVSLKYQGTRELVECFMDAGHTLRAPSPLVTDSNGVLPRVWFDPRGPVYAETV